MGNRYRGAFIEKKKWLASYQELKEEIEEETRQAGFWQDKAIGLKSPYLSFASGKSANHKSMMDFANKFLEVAEYCSELADKALEKKKQILDAINQIPEADARRVLKLHYICGKDFLEIATQLNYSIRWVYCLHRRALCLIEIPEVCSQIP